MPGSASPLSATFGCVTQPKFLAVSSSEFKSRNASYEPSGERIKRKRVEKLEARAAAVSDAYGIQQNVHVRIRAVYFRPRNPGERQLGARLMKPMTADGRSKSR